MLNQLTTVEETTTTVEETTTTEATTEEVTEAQSAPATYQAEPSQGASATYTAPAAPDYATIAATKLKMQVSNHKQLPSKRKLPSYTVSHHLVVTVQEIQVTTEKVLLLTSWFQ